MKVRVWIFMLLFLGVFGVLGKDVSAKGKEERLPDGRLLLEGLGNQDSFISDGKNLYYSVSFGIDGKKIAGIYSISKKNYLLRSQILKI